MRRRARLSVLQDRRMYKTSAGTAAPSFEQLRAQRTKPGGVDA